jgi:hypothetical protein
MPTIKGNAAAATGNALEGVKFSVIPNSGAAVNMWISCAANGGTFGLAIGDRDIVIPGTEANVEVAADVIDVARDQVVFNEIVGPGQLYLPIGAAGTEIQWQIHIRYL